jgi:hypothetical protein
MPCRVGGATRRLKCRARVYLYHSERTMAETEREQLRIGPMGGCSGTDNLPGMPVYERLR